MITIAALSDTHGMHARLDIPLGDILVLAGDLIATGTLSQVADFNRFLAGLPHLRKTIIVGDHGFCCETHSEEARALFTEAIYLQDESATVESLRFYGASWSTQFFDWAFMLPPEPKIRAKWEAIPTVTDVRITHGPPWAHDDRTERGERVCVGQSAADPHVAGWMRPIGGGPCRGGELEPG